MLAEPARETDSCGIEGGAAQTTRRPRLSYPEPMPARKEDARQRPLGPDGLSQARHTRCPDRILTSRYAAGPSGQSPLRMGDSDES